MIYLLFSINSTCIQDLSGVEGTCFNMVNTGVLSFQRVPRFDYHQKSSLKTFAKRKS